MSWYIHVVNFDRPSNGAHAPSDGEQGVLRRFLGVERVGKEAPAAGEHQRPSAGEQPVERSPVAGRREPSQPFDLVELHTSAFRPALPATHPAVAYPSRRRPAA